MISFLVRLFFHLFDRWTPNEPILRWGRGATLTISQTYEGSVSFGATGSGKTSSSIWAQTVAMMRAGYGIVFLTTKGTSPSDTDLCLSMAREAGRIDSVVKIGPSHGLGFNILRYEMQTALELGSGDLATNVASIFTAAADLAAPTRNAKSGEHIWTQAVESLVRHAVTLLFHATDDLRLDDIVGVVKSAPQTLAQLNDPAWCRESICFQFCELLSLSSRPNIKLARDYFLGEFPTFPPDTKNSVLFTFSAGCSDLLQREPLKGMFFAATDYTPDILLDGGIILCDCPVLQFREVGRIANGLIRASAHRALERRVSHTVKRPVAIIWDEAQKSLLRSDVSFQETARSSLCAVVTATQHLPALQDVVGLDLAKNFLGNLRTTIFFQNNEKITGDYMQGLCGRKDAVKKTVTKNSDGKTSTSSAPDKEDALPYEATHNLKTGGEANGYKVTGFLITGSKKLANGEPYKKILFDQKSMRASWWPFSNRVQVIARQRPCPDFTYLNRKGP